MESFPVQLAPELEIPGTWRGTREDFHGSFPWICAQLHTFTADIPWTHPGDSASEPVPSTSPKFRASTRAPGDCCLRIPCFKRCCKKTSTCLNSIFCTLLLFRFAGLFLGDHNDPSHLTSRLCLLTSVAGTDGSSPLELPEAAAPPGSLKPVPMASEDTTSQLQALQCQPRQQGCPQSWRKGHPSALPCSSFSFQLKHTAQGLGTPNTRARRNTCSRDVRPKVWVSTRLCQTGFAAIMGTTGLQHKVLKKKAKCWPRARWRKAQTSQ